MRDGWLVKPDKRAVVLAGAAVVLAVILGYWAGALAGVLAALAGLIPRQSSRLERTGRIRLMRAGPD